MSESRRRVLSHPVCPAGLRRRRLATPFAGQARPIQAAWMVILCAGFGNLGHADDAPTRGADLQPVPPVVSAFERFGRNADALDERERDAVQSLRLGELLVGELACTACHQADPATAARLTARPSPRLGRVSQRVQSGHLRDYVADPHTIKPGAVMPDVLHGLPDDQRATVAETIMHFLALGGATESQAPRFDQVVRGEELFHTVGCVACHEPRRDGPKAMVALTGVPGGSLGGRDGSGTSAASAPSSETESPDTAGQAAPAAGASPNSRATTSIPWPTDLSAKYTLGSLTRFLRNPHDVRPGGRMPNLRLSDNEAASIAAYLLPGQLQPGRWKVDYFEATINTLADFDKARQTVTRQTETDDIDLKLGRKERFGLVMRGTLRLEKETRLRFRLGSDDGSRLIVAGKTLQAIDGLQATQFKEADATLPPGDHDIEVHYYQGGGDAELVVEYREADRRRFRPLSPDLTPLREPARPVDSPLTVDLNKAEAGATAFAAHRCNACHTLDGHPWATRADLAGRPTSAKRLAQLDLAKGCLADAVPSEAVEYHLDPAQRVAIREALSSPRPTDAPSAPAESPSAQTPRLQTSGSQAVPIDVTLARFNCYACHQRDGLGGVEMARNAHFTGTEPEMGDEGRLPPHLTGVGDKLQSGWLERVLRDGQAERPYMKTRMPAYRDALPGLAEALIAADQKTDAPPVSWADFTPRQVKEQGHTLVGDKALACIKCHTFGDYKATGVQSVDLTRITERLREDWFRRYLADPQVFRPGTRMPAGWPDGATFYPGVLDGEPTTQIAAVWAYLADGRNAAIPSGLITDRMVLVPTERAMIYRNFIEGAGARAIAVGDPARVHYAWDAERFRPVLLWQNEFIDAKRHWSARGVGFEPPLGGKRINLAERATEGPPVAILADGNPSWPGGKPREQGFRFQGYTLDEAGRPTFRFTQGEVAFTDSLRPGTPDDQGQWESLVQTVTTEADTLPEGLTYRAIAASSIEREGDGFRINGAWTVLVRGGQPTVRTVEGHKELLVPLSGQPLEIEYRW